MIGTTSHAFICLFSRGIVLWVVFRNQKLRQHVKETLRGIIKHTLQSKFKLI